MATKDKGLTPVRARGVVLVAEDLLTDVMIAAELRVGRRTLATWKNEPTFRDAVIAHRKQLAAAIMDEGISQVHNQVRRANQTRKELLQIIQERGEFAVRQRELFEEREAERVRLALLDPLARAIEGTAAGPTVQEYWPVPGDELGHIVEVSSSKDGARIFAIDTAILGEIRALEVQAMKLLGKIIEQPAPGASSQSAESEVDISVLSVEETERLLELTEKLHGATQSVESTPESCPA